MKKFLITCLAVAAVTFSTFAADVIGVNPSAAVAYINSTNTASTTMVFGVTTNGIWPCGIAPSSNVTNVTAIPLGAAKDVAIQFTGADQSGSGGTVLLKMGRNIQGGTATNAIGTGLNIDWGPTVALVLPASTVSTTVCTNFYSGTATATLGGAVGTVYIGWITTPANVVLTNYSVYVNKR